MSLETISLIFSLIANLVLALFLFFKPALNEWVKETFLSKARKRGERSKLLGKLQKYTYQFTNSVLLRLKFVKMDPGEVTASMLVAIEAKHKKAHDFLIENKYQFSQDLQDEIQKLTEAAGLQNEELTLTTYAHLYKMIETEQAES